MGHFDEGSSLPPPFNLIITPKAVHTMHQRAYQLSLAQVFYCVRGAWDTLAAMCGRSHWHGGKQRKSRATIRVGDMALLPGEHLHRVILPRSIAPLIANREPSFYSISRGLSLTIRAHM